MAPAGEADVNEACRALTNSTSTSFHFFCWLDAYSNAVVELMDFPNWKFGRQDISAHGRIAQWTWLHLLKLKCAWLRPRYLRPCSFAVGRLVDCVEAEIREGGGRLKHSQFIYLPAAKWNKKRSSGFRLRKVPCTRTSSITSSALCRSRTSRRIQSDLTKYVTRRKVYIQVHVQP